MPDYLVKDNAIVEEVRSNAGSADADVAQRLLVLARQIGAEVDNKKGSASIRLPGRPGAATKEVTLFFIAKEKGSFWIHDNYLRRWPSAGVPSSVMDTFHRAVVSLFGSSVKARQMHLANATPLALVSKHFDDLERILRVAAHGILGTTAVAPLIDIQTTDFESDALHLGELAVAFGDPVRNARVERSAVDHTTASYVSAGWSVASVERDKVGYDLVCTRGKEIEHVEVKGVSGARPLFIISANEVNSARTNPRFVLSVVTSALDSPVVHRWSGEDFLGGFALKPIAFSASPLLIETKEA